MDEIPAGQTMTCAFGALSHQDRPQGSCTAEIDGPAACAPLLAPALDLPPEDALRGRISAQAEITPDTVYLNQPLLTTLEPKILADGSALGPIQIAAMLLRSACADADLPAADFEIHGVRCLPETRAATIRIRVRRTAAPA